MYNCVLEFVIVWGGGLVYLGLIAPRPYTMTILREFVIVRHCVLEFAIIYNRILGFVIHDCAVEFVMMSNHLLKIVMHNCVLEFVVMHNCYYWNLLLLL